MRNNRWIPVVAALLFATMVGVVAYNMGVAQASEGTVRGWYGPGWYGPGWHGAWFAPFFFIALWIVIARVLFRRGHWNRGGGRCGLDEWHRQAHERMWNEPSGEGKRG
jgi:hypothetical protein